MKIISASTQQESSKNNERPLNFENFIGQEHIKKILKTAILSAKKRNDVLGHILLSGDSGFGKTTIAQIIANQLGKQLKIVTAYAMEKPADMISILNQLEDGDILFIDEIHRLKPKIEEILYIAMEDYRIDIIVNDETMNIPLSKFTLIGATNKLENLSDAFKNRFVYKFHLKPYSQHEIKKILRFYLQKLNIQFDKESIDILSTKCLPIPREIKNLAIKIRDFLSANNLNKLDRKVTEQILEKFKFEDFGLSDLQKRYIEILKEKDLVGIKTISALLNVNEKVIEKDIEPMLLNLGIIEKTSRGRKLLKKIF